jgi:hypothetical protein
MWFDFFPDDLVGPIYPEKEAFQNQKEERSRRALTSWWGLNERLKGEEKKAARKKVSYDRIRYAPSIIDVVTAST